MRNAVITILTLVIIISIFMTFTEKKDLSEQVSITFMEKMLSANPKEHRDVFNLEKVDHDGFEAYVENLINFIKLEYSEIATERMLNYLFTSRDILLVYDISYKSNSNVSLESFEITYTEETDDKIYYHFEGTTKVVSQNTDEEFSYPFTGQIGLINDNGTFKVDTLRFFSQKLYDHLILIDELENDQINS